MLDLETTGLWPKTDRIVEIGLVRVTADGRRLEAGLTWVTHADDMGGWDISGGRGGGGGGGPKFSRHCPGFAGGVWVARDWRHITRGSILGSLARS